MGEWYSPREVAAVRKIRLGKVLAWIRTGELLAVNLAEKPRGRPRWRISAEALDAFDTRRSNRAGMKPAASRKQKRPSVGVVEFF